MQRSARSIDDCVERRRTEVSRYYDTVMLTLGLKHFLEERNLACRFVSAERIFHTFDNKTANPDITLQYGDNSFGIVCEVKTSLPQSDAYLLKELQSLEKYCKPLVGWETPTNVVKDHDVVLLCYLHDADRVLNKLTQWVGDGTLKFEKEVSIWEWVLSQSFRHGEGEVVYIRHKHGNIGCPALNNAVIENVKYNIDKLALEYETCRFTRKEPPSEYVMEQLWLYIFSFIGNPGENFETSIDDILRTAYDYYIPWSNIQGEFSQVRISWINKAMEHFCEIGLARKKEEAPGRFEILYGKQIPKDFLEYVIERLCKLRFAERALPEDALTMETLDGYF